MRNSDDNAPQDQNLIGASVTDLTAEDINTSENSPYTATATAVDRVDSQDESRADKDGSDVLDTPDISFLLKDYDNHFDGLGDLSFSQEGSDLRVVDGDGNEYIIAGYFDEAPPPSLRISESTELPFDFVQTLLAGTDLPAASGETPRATMVDAHDYAEYGSSIGNVETIVGEVKIIRTDGQTQILEAGDPVFEGDQILTETGASVKLVFLDNTLFSLGEDAQMTLDKMLYNAEEESGEVVLSMLKGMFLFVSGKIAKTDPTDMVVNTPVATIGIRGTIVTGRIDPDAQQTFEITVIDGAIATIPSGSDEPIVMSESFSTIIGENNAAGNLEISQSQETPQAVVARNVQQFSVLSSEDLQGIELAVESSAAESGEDVDLDLESALEIAVENETLGDVDAEQEDAVVDTPIPDAPAASNGAEEVEFESDVLLEDERPLEETLELEEEEESKGLEPAPELDITPPDPPLFVLAVNENNYLESGNSIIEGETEAGALVSVTLAGSLTNPDGTVSQSEAVFETLADDAGNWAIDFENDDPVSGNYNFAEESEVQLSVTAADASGNVSDAETGSFNFDLTAPEAPVIAPDSSVSYTASDNTTYIDGKTLSGTAEAGTTVHVTVDSETVDVTADEDGNWTLDLGANGIKPDHGDNITVSAQSEDKAGNLGETATQTYVVDSQTTAPQIAFNDLKNEATDNSPALSGTAEPGATVEVIVDDGKNSETFSVDADSNGNWTLDLGQESDGTLSLTHDVTLTAKATATDLAGNTSGTASTSVKIDDSTTLSDVGFDKVVNSTTVDGDAVSMVDGDPLLSGTAEPGSEVVVTVTDGDDNQTTFTPTVDASGNWSVMIVSKDDFEIKDGGSFSVKVDSKDLHENTATVSLGPYDVDASTVDPTISFDTAVTGEVGAEPVLTGTAEPGSTVTVTVDDGTNSEVIEVDADESGNWTLTLDGTNSGNVDLTHGSTLTASATSKDALGNESLNSASTTSHTVDASTVDPTIAFDTAVTGEVGAEPVLTGTAEPDSKVYVTVDDGTNSEVIEVDAGGSGNWSLTLDGTNSGNVDLTHGSTLTASATSTDVHGNESVNSASTTEHTVDASTADPTIAFDTAVTGEVGATPVLTGTAEPGSKVYVTVDDGTNSEVIEVDAGGSGNWSLTLDGTNSGNVDLTHGSTLTASATSTDVHENESVNSASTTEHTVDASTYLSNVAFDNVVNNEVGAKPVLKGIAEPGSTVTVVVTDKNGNEATYTPAVDDETGAWSVEVTGDPQGTGFAVTDDGTLSAVVDSKDELGNEATQVSLGPFGVDATVSDSDAAFADAIGDTVGAEPVLSGTAEPDSMVKVTVTDGSGKDAVFTTKVGSSGTWSVTVTGDPQQTGFAVTDDGTLVASAHFEDPLGNTATVALDPYKVDASTTDPVFEFTTGTDDTSDKTPELVGTAEADAIVSVKVTDSLTPANSETFTVTADSNGDWSLSIDSNNAGSLSLGHDVTLTAEATSTDIHNNESNSSKAEATIDAEADVGTFAFEGASGTTVGAEPVLSGQEAEPNAQVIVIIEDAYGNTATFSTTADDKGDWSITVTSGGDTGNDALVVTHGTSLSASVTVIDEHNNSTTEKSLDTYTVDALTTLSNVGFESLASGLTDGTPVLSGTAEPGSSISVHVKGSTGGEATFTTSADASGNWSVTVSDQTGFTITDKDTLTATVTSTDSVGNSATETASATVDASIVTPTISFADSVNDVTDGTPVLSGTAEPGSSISVHVKGSTGGEATFTTSADASGNWSVTVTDQTGFTITDKDTLTATVTSTDSVGNSATETASATVDASIVTPTISFADSVNDVTDGTPVLSGTAEPGSSISVHVKGSTGGEATFTTSADASGNWSVTVSDQTGFTITDTDTLTATVTSTDSVGNSATETASATVDASIVTPTISFADSVNDVTDGTPVLSGTAEPGSSISVHVKGSTGGEATFTTSADASGNWSVTVSDQTGFTITDKDTLTATVTSTDSVGNSATETASATVDASIVTPTISFADSVNDVTDGTPVLSGTAEPGSSISVHVKGSTGGEATFTTSADASGNWSVTVSDQTGFTITDKDTLTATVTSTDSVGNSATETASATVDASIVTPTISFADSVNDVTDGTPVLSGTAEPGSSISVHVKGSTGGEATFTTSADASGNWSVTVTDQTGFTITDKDTLTATVTSTDSVGNSATETASATVDASIVTPTISFADSVNDVTDGTPVLSGTAEPGSSISVHVKGSTGGEATFTTSADASGNWSVTVTDQTGFTITDKDTLTATVTSTDSVGNSATETASATVDASIVTPTISFADSVNDVTDGTPVLSGTAEPGSSISVHVKGSTGGEATFTTSADASGNWSVTVTDQTGFTITDTDTLTATVTSTDSVGNSATETASATVDASIVTPTISFADSVNDVTDGTPVLSGTAEPGSSISVHVKGSTGGEATFTTSADASGNWSVTVSDQTGFTITDKDTLTATVTSTDSVGNSATETASATVDASIVTPTISFADSVNDVTDGTPVLSGTAEPGSSISVHVKGSTGGEATFTTSADASGNWSVTVSDQTGFTITDKDTLTATVTSTDSVGNSATETASATVDASIVTPTISFADSVNDVTDGTPVLSGTAEPGSSISVHVKGSTGGEATFTTSADASGNWSVTVTDQTGFTITDKDTLTATVTSTDSVGNSATETASATVDASIVTPTISFADSVNDVTDGTPVLSGTAEPGSSISVHVKGSTGGEATFTTSADASGNWSVTVTDQTGFTITDKDTLTATVTSTDSVGNSATETASATVDASIVTPTISFADSVNDVTDGTPVLSGTAEPGSSISVHVKGSTGGEATFTTSADASGNWSVTVTDQTGFTITDKDTLTATVTSTDSVGNSATETASATVDASIVTPTISFADSVNDVTDGTPVLSGTAEPGSSISVHVKGSTGGEATFTTSADASGNWSVTVSDQTGFTITDKDTLTATVTSTDSVGNSATETASATVDASIVTPTISFADSVNDVTDGTPVLSGTAEPGSSISVHVKGSTGGEATFTTSADASGNWSVTVSDQTGFTITDKDTLTATVTSTDSVGNSATETASATVDASIVTPTISFADSVNDVTDGTPVLSGTAEPGSSISVHVKGSTGGEATFTTSADASGNWSVTVTDQTGFTITDKDTLTATVTSTDSVGNSATETASATVDASIVTPTISFADSVNDVTDGTPVLSGTAEPGSSISVHVKGSTGGEATFTTSADASGNWSVTVTDQTGFTITDKDTLTATVTSTDSVGNSATETASATVDASIVTPTISFADSVNDVTDGTPVLSGTAEPGSSISVHVKGSTGGEATFTTSADASGNWSVTVTDQTGFTITDTDTLTATVTSTDSVGNSATETASATVDASIVTPTISFADSVNDVTDGTPVLSGTAEPGSSISVHVKGSTGGEATFTTSADASGNWSVTVSDQTGFTITDKDTLTATVTSTDSVGNSATETASATVDASIVTPTISFADSVNDVTDGTPVLSGTAEPGSSISVHVKGSTGGEATFTTSADASGNWSVTVSDQTGFTITDKDTLTATVTSTDSVGNSATETASATVDASIVTPTISFADSVNDVTDGTPVLSGTAEPGSSISVHVKGSTGGEATFTTSADASGNWSVTVTDQTGFTITDKDTLTATVTSTDSVGNSATETASATVDASIVTPTISFADSVNDVTDGTPVLSGTAEPGSSISVHVKGSTGGEATFTTSADASGNWSVTVTDQTGFTITDKDTLTATVTSTDSVGNSATETASATVDASIVTPTISFADSVNDVTDGTPVLSGTAEPGSSISVHVKGSTGGEATFTTSADASGNWSVTVTDQTGFTITDKDTLTATVTSTDSVGNSATETASATVDASIVTPTISFADSVNDVTDGTPVLSGTAEPGSSISVHVKGSTGGEATFTTSADASGNWSVTVSDQTGFTITDKDTLTATVTSTDSVGNSATETASATVDASIVTPTISFADSVNDVTDGTPVLSGTAEPGSSISVHVKGSTGGEATFTTSADASGNWSVTVSDQTGFTITDKDTLTATVTSTDSVGNSATETASATVDNSTYLTNVAFDNILNDTTVGGKPVLSGVAEVGATVTVVVTDGTNSATYTPTVGTDGSWSVDIVNDTASAGSVSVSNGGTLSATVDSQDALENDATTVNLGPYTVDAVAADPTVDILDQTPENIAKLVAGTESLFSGTADPNAAIKVEVTFPSGSTPASLTLDAQANGSGDWAISFNDLGSNKTAFTHGAAITLAVTATDPILNVSNTVTETYTVDYTTNETVDDNTFAGTTGDEVNFETQKADYLGPVSLTDSITSATTSKDEITTLTSFDDTVFVEDRGATYTNLGDGDDTIKFLKDEIAGVTGGTVFVDGGDGDDTADFSELTSSLYVNLSATAGTDVVRHTMSDGSILYRSFNDVENISTSSGRDLVEINRLTDLPNIDAGDGIDRLVLSQGGSTNIIDLTGGTSTIDGNTVTMSGFEVFETGANLDSVNTVIVDRDAVYVNGGSSAVSSSADYDTLQVSESGTVNFAAVDVATDGYTYAGLHEYMTYATFFEKIEVSSDALMVLQTDEWQLKGATNSTATSGVSNINISADASSGLMIDIESLWLNSSHWSYNDGTGETYLSTFTDSTSVQHNGSAYLRHGTEDLQIDLDADAVAAINNTYVHKNDGYGVSNTYNWSALTWYNGINVKQADQDESNHHVVLAEAIGYADNITIDAATNGVTIQSLTGAANLTLDENLTITGDMYDYIGAVTINNGHKLDVGGTLDMSTSSEMIMSYSTSTGAAVSADHIDFAGSVELHVDYSSVNPNNADPQTGIIEEWAVFDASSTSGSIDELIFKTSNGSEFVDSDLGAVVLVGTADGGVQVVKYDSSKHTLDDGSNDLTGTTNSEVYYGFAGDDSITISDYDSDSDGVNDSVHLQYLDGGEGHDTLALDGNADSFQSLFTDELFRINRIETLDISDLEGTLTLDEAAVLGLSDLKGSAKDGITGAYSEWTELTIEGDGNTTLDLNGFAVDTSTSLARSGYTVYKSADSVVYVDDEIGTVK